MTTLFALNGKILFQTVREAMKELGIAITEENPRAVLVWYDSIKDADYFSNLNPWQVVNRIPLINLICRKAPFVRTLQRVGLFFPALFDFLPKSYILPHQNIPFGQICKASHKKYIIKPDGGALGNGIQILESYQSYQPLNRLAIAQEYIESYLLDDYKFDFRVYALVACVHPLEVYVYRDGIARFCSEPASMKGMFSQLTNTAVNSKNPGVTAGSITHTIKYVFDVLAKKGANIEKIWKDIDKTVALTMIAVSGFIAKSASQQCPSVGYPRCFQLLGFDIMLDKNLKPYVLEVNYRPSLEYGTIEEKKLKIQMLKEMMTIVAPFRIIDETLAARDKLWNFVMWRAYLDRNPQILSRVNETRESVAKNTNFRKVFPNNSPEAQSWYNVLNVVNQMPTDVNDSYSLPRMVDYIPPQMKQRQPLEAPSIHSNQSNQKPKIYSPNIKKSKK